MAFIDKISAGIQAAFEEEIASYTQQITTLEQSIADLKTLAATSETARGVLKAQVDTLNSTLAARDATIKSRDTKIAQLEARIKELEANETVKPEEPPVEPEEKPSPGLFYKLPDNIRSFKRKAFAHYFSPGPISIDNKPELSDYYHTGFNMATGESGKWTARGGYYRDRPLGRAPITGTTAEWQLADMRTEVKRAAAHGLDGFFCNIMGSSGASGWERYVTLKKAANLEFPDGSFKVIAMPDTNGAMIKNNEPLTTVADRIAHFAYDSLDGTRKKSPSAYFLPDGRYVVSSFKADGKPASWWDSVFKLLDSRHGLKVAFLAGFLNLNDATNPSSSFAGFPWSFGAGDWGSGADPNIAKTSGDLSKAVLGRGWVWMGPLSWSNYRNAQGVFDEQIGTAALRERFNRIQREHTGQEVAFAQPVTWNDFGEGSAFAPSVAHGFVPIELSGYYLHRWKTGQFPKILVDEIIISHRNQWSDRTKMTFTGPQTTFVSQWNRSNKSPLQDVVEVVTYLTAPGQVTVTVGGQKTTYDAPAGEFVKLVPLQNGEVSASVTRNSATTISVKSPVKVSTTQPKQDMQYFSFSGIRGTLGQYDPSIYG